MFLSQHWLLSLIRNNFPQSFFLSVGRNVGQPQYIFLLYNMRGISITYLFLIFFVQGGRKGNRVQEIANVIMLLSRFICALWGNLPDVCIFRLRACIFVAKAKKSAHCWVGEGDEMMFWWAKQPLHISMSVRP